MGAPRGVSEVSEVSEVSVEVIVQKKGSRGFFFSRQRAPWSCSRKVPAAVEGVGLPVPYPVPAAVYGLPVPAAVYGLPVPYPVPAAVYCRTRALVRAGERSLTR